MRTRSALSTSSSAWVEQPRPVLDARDVQRRREAQLEREPCEQSLADAVDGADERLRHLLCERGPAHLDESLSDAVLNLGRRLDRERGRDDPGRLRRSLGQCTFELLGQTVRLAAPGAGPDEAHMRKIARLGAHWNSPHPVRRPKSS